MGISDTIMDAVDEIESQVLQHTDDLRNEPDILNMLGHMTFVRILMDSPSGKRTREDILETLKDQAIKFENEPILISTINWLENDLEHNPSLTPGRFSYHLDYYIDGREWVSLKSESELQTPNEVVLEVARLVNESDKSLDLDSRYITVTMYDRDGNLSETTSYFDFTEYHFTSKLDTLKVHWAALNLNNSRPIGYSNGIVLIYCDSKDVYGKLAANNEAILAQMNNLIGEIEAINYTYDDRT